jgi:hypothetical protein
MKIKAYGFPWQKVKDHWSTNLDKTIGQTYGWNPFSVKGMGRFGGGWAFKLGITVDRTATEWIIELGIGAIRIHFKK